MQIINTPKLYDWEAFEHIAQYLTLSDLVKTSTLSKQYNYTLRNYLKKFLLPKDSSQSGQNQFTSIKKLFHRQIKIFKVNDKQGEQSIQPNIILKDIQMGNNYVLLQTYQGSKFIIPIDQLAKKNFQLKELVKLDKKYQKKFTILIGDCLYIASQNKLLKISIQKNQDGLFHQDELIDFDSQITQIKTSPTHLFIIIKNTFEEHQLFAVHLKEFKSVEVLYQQNQKKTKHLNSQKLATAANTAYYINTCKVYELDIQNFKQPKLMKSFKDKQINKIVNGAKHFFAIEKTRKLTEEWDTTDVIEWASKQGYEDYIKIFKSQKVTGKTLLNIDKKYLQDVLGLVNVKMQQRLMVQLQEFNLQNEQNCTIYGWGRNDKSQLGLNPSNPVSNPHKITFPEGFKLLKCFHNITLIHNKKSGQISMSLSVEGKLVWQPVFNNVYNIWSINASKDYLAVLCPVEKDYISQQLSQVPVHHKKQKLRTAKNIIDKIQWDQNIDKNQFRVGYLDKFTGILEISFSDYLLSTEIKEYRIQYFKRKGQIVWSKKDRIDVL